LLAKKAAPPVWPEEVKKKKTGERFQGARFFVQGHVEPDKVTKYLPFPGK